MPKSSASSRLSGRAAQLSGTKGPLRSFGEGVQQARDPLFADPGFAAEHDVDSGRRDPANGFEHLPDRRRFADEALAPCDIAKFAVFVGESLAVALDGGDAARSGDRGGDHAAQGEQEAGVAVGEGDPTDPGFLVAENHQPEEVLTRPEGSRQELVRRVALIALGANKSAGGQLLEQIRRKRDLRSPRSSAADRGPGPSLPVRRDAGSPPVPIPRRGCRRLAAGVPRRAPPRGGRGRW